MKLINIEGTLINLDKVESIKFYTIEERVESHNQIVGYDGIAGSLPTTAMIGFNFANDSISIDVQSPKAYEWLKTTCIAIFDSSQPEDES